MSSRPLPELRALPDTAQRRRADDFFEAFFLAAGFFRAAAFLTAGFLAAGFLAVDLFETLLKITVVPICTWGGSRLKTITA